MKAKTLNLLYFSPTGTSKKVVESFGEGFSGLEPKRVDLTRSITGKDLVFSPGDLVVFGVPVYAGRVATTAVERLEKMEGNGAMAVLVVLYGNREFEDALVELRDLVSASGFKPVAGAAFIGEHSFSGSDMPIAQGRPDADDVAAAKAFAGVVQDLLEPLNDGQEVALLKVPGNIPYKEGMPGLPFSPEINKEICTLCAACIDTCPMEAMTLDQELHIAVEKCIFCCACVKNCPEGAIQIAAPPILEKVKWLHENCQTPKKPQLFY